MEKTFEYKIEELLVKHNESLLCRIKKDSPVELELENWFLHYREYSLEAKSWINYKKFYKNYSFDLHFQNKYDHPKVHKNVCLKCITDNKEDQYEVTIRISDFDFESLAKIEEHNQSVILLMEELFESEVDLNKLVPNIKIEDKLNIGTPKEPGNAFEKRFVKENSMSILPTFLFPSKKEKEDYLKENNYIENRIGTQLSLVYQFELLELPTKLKGLVDVSKCKQ